MRTLRNLRLSGRKPGVHSREETTKDKRTYYNRYEEAAEALKRAEAYGNKDLAIKVNPRTGRFYLERVGRTESSAEEEK